MKDYFILKVLFILKLFNFLSWLFDHVGRTANISLKKGNQTMKRGQLTEYNIFFYQNYAEDEEEETSSIPLCFFNKA